MATYDKHLGVIVPAGPRHIPHAIERASLQKMNATDGLTAEKMHPAGKQTLASMLAKGWIERRVDGQGREDYVIAEAGQQALRTPIPQRR